MGLGAVIAAIAAFLARLITEETVKYVAFRLFLWSLFVFVLPVVLYNLFGRIVSEVANYAFQQVQSNGVSSQVVQLTGLAAWLVAKLKVPESLSVIFSAISLRFALSFIPFMRW